MGRLRVLLLDDEPRFVESADSIIPSFDNQYHAPDRELFERNFELSWLYDVDQAKRLFNLFDHARVNDPPSLLKAIAYPNLIWIDYNFDQTHVIDIEFDREPELARQYKDTLDPFRGRDAAALPLSPAQPEAKQFGSTRLPGCVAGISLAMLLRDVACQPVPITAMTDTSETDFYEQFLDEQYGRMFALKTDTLLTWYAFFERGLSELRQQIVRAVANGTMTPKVMTFDRAIVDGEIKLDHLLTFQSAYGVESFRVEALFFDLLYYYEGEPDEGRLLRAPRQTDDATSDDEIPPEAAIREWLDELLCAATGTQAVGELRESIRIADRHRSALLSYVHGIRLELSGQLAKADGQSSEVIDTVITSNAGNIELLGLDAEEVREALTSGTVSSLKIPPDKHRKLMIVRPLKAEGAATQGHDQDGVVRAAALALLVFVEYAWVKTQRGDIAALCEDFAELLKAEDAMREDLLYELEQGDRLPVRPERLPQIRTALREGRIDPALAQEIGLFQAFGNAIAITSSTDVGFEDEELLSGAGSNRPSPRLHDEVSTKSVLAAELFNPAPAHLLMSRHRKFGGDDVRQALRRLQVAGTPAPLHVNKILRDDLEAGGLRPGDGRLIKVFAAHYGFLLEDWPNWMRASARF